LSAVLESLVVKRGSLERISAGRVRRKEVVLLNKGFVGRRGRKSVAVGQTVGGGRIAEESRGRQEVIGADFLDVRWLPDVALDIARRLDLSHNGRVVGLRGMRTVFATSLPPIAFVSEWLAADSLHRNVRLLESLEIPVGGERVFQRLAAVREAVRLITADFPRSAPSGFSR
jgi:hypothetical protein